MYIFILYVRMRVPQLLGCSQQQVSCASARSIVVLSQPRVKPDESDARSLRTVLSLSQVLHPVDDPVRCSSVAPLEIDLSLSLSTATVWSSVCLSVCLCLVSQASLRTSAVTRKSLLFL